MKKTENKKVIRDSFSMPTADHQIIDEIRDRALEQKVVATKAEVLRAGLHALKALDDEGLVRLLNSLEKTRPGRRARTNKEAPNT